MYFLIANPSSRSGNSGAEALKLRAVLDVQHLPSTVCYTTGPGDATRIAREISRSAAEKKKTANIVIFGGDGTINEVLAGIENFDYVNFGIVPVGSGNDMAKGLGLPDSNPRLFARIAEGTVQRTIDYGYISFDHLSGDRARGYSGELPEGIRFANGSGIGFDAAVCEEVNATGTKGLLNLLGLGKLSYGMIALKQLFGAKKSPCRIETDDGRIYHFKNILLLCGMNLPYQGGGYCFAKDADPSDGMINITIAGNLSKARMLLCFERAKKGKLYGTRGITHLRCRSLKVKTERPLWVQTDGEVHVKADEITISAVPGKIRLIV